MPQNVTEFKIVTEKPTMIVWDFNTLLTLSDRTSKNREDNTIHQLDPIYRLLYLATAKQNSFQPNIEHLPKPITMGHKTILHNLKGFNHTEYALTLELRYPQTFGN